MHKQHRTQVLIPIWLNKWMDQNIDRKGKFIRAAIYEKILHNPKLYAELEYEARKVCENNQL